MIMYDNLQTINLTEYLNKCCGGVNWIKEDWLTSLNLFVGNLSEKNKNILKSKIKNNLEHYQINDIVNEIMVACAYHPKAIFIKESGNKSYDLFDEDLNLKIEVKSLNEGGDEKERHKLDKFSCISKSLNNSETQSEERHTEEIISKKCNDHFSKAATQIDNKGKIYLIWDYNLLKSENIGSKKEPIYTRTHHSIVSKKDIESLIKNCINNFSNDYRYVAVEAIYFEDLREKVANSK